MCNVHQLAAIGQRGIAKDAGHDPVRYRRYQSRQALATVTRSNVGCIWGAPPTGRREYGAPLQCGLQVHVAIAAAQVPTGVVAHPSQQQGHGMAAIANTLHGHL